jgi:histidinol-phosphate phosphatase family protein
MSALSSAAPARAVFIDWDGTLVADLPHHADPDRLAFTPNALDALRLLSDAGYRIVLVSNQPDEALGHADQAAPPDRLGQALAQRLRDEGIALDGLYVCPHPPGAGCNCRRPAPGLLHAAAHELALDLSRSWMIGDTLDDIEAGRRAGCRTVLLDVGHDAIRDLTPPRTPDLRAPDLLAAARVIKAWDDAPPDAALPNGPVTEPSEAA